MNGESRELLLEAAVTAFRERDTHGRLLPAPAWWDLPEEARVELFERQMNARRLERAVDPMGHSATVKAVLNRIFNR